MAIVVFDPIEFKFAYPAYQANPNEQLINFFSLSELIISNTDASIVPYDPDGTPPVLERKFLLSLLVAHFSELGVKGAGAVGRTNSGSEGSISFSFDMVTNGSNQWFLQTQWGASFWQATAKYRTARLYCGRPPRRNISGTRRWY